MDIFIHTRKMAHAPAKAEVKEMVELYVQKGFTEDEARRILSIMAKYKEFFIDHMLVQVRLWKDTTRKVEFMSDREKFFFFLSSEECLHLTHMRSSSRAHFQTGTRNHAAG